VSLTLAAHGRETPITRANPVTKLFAALAITVVLLLSVDVVSALTALTLELLVLPWCGLSAGVLLRRLSPVLIAAGSAGVVTCMIGVDSGAVLLDLGLLDVTTGSLSSGVAITFRVLAVGVPGIVLLASTDPTDLADALAQRLRLPHRFVLGALAGLRLVGLMVEDWRTLSLARRARGVGDDRGPIGGARVLAGQAFALLVLAIRRGTRLATAMEARGFGAAGPRTWARPSTFGLRDAALAGGAALTAGTSVAAAHLAGTWSFILT
jgi:energy-coupling factor transport system permease protein